MIIANKYKIIEKIGEGCFGFIFKGENIRTFEKVAIKMESISSETNLLKNEAKIYQYLKGCNHSGGEGFPTVKWFGVIDIYYYMVLPLLGDSLCNKTFPIKPLFSISIDIIKRIQYIHENGLIHRDIKPDNFLLGANNDPVIHLIDFGFCRKYLKADNKTHIDLKTNRPMIGTPNFVSVNVHNGLEPSRRDDLESVAYMMIYFQLGQLEWMNPGVGLDKMREMKINVFNNMKIHPSILIFLDYCRKLRFEETPDYNKTIGFFQSV
jgi:serine/threonine protein kinase